MAYTLGQAAKAVNRNKATLSAAIKKGRISAVKDKDGVFHIEEAELFRVYPQNGPPTGGQTADEQADKHNENSALEARLKVLEELVSELRADKQAANVREVAASEREAALRRDLEQWRGFAAEYHSRLKALEAPKAHEDGGQIIEAQAQELDAPDPAPSPTEDQGGKGKRGAFWWLWPWALIAA